MSLQRRLRVAAIMDEFTYNCYAPECDIIQITPDSFRQEIDGFQPEFLFIESVWRGKDNLWRFKLHDNTEALRALTSYCRRNGIPVVFWSKEDPVHFGVFLLAASMADFVFTTDADCIELYKAYLGHDRVYYLPFAAQPAIHNPIEEYERKDKFCFAGSFYVKYKERSRVFRELAPLFQARGLDIYDRNYKKGETDNNKQSTSVASPLVENYFFPPELRDNILGMLPYSEISRAYKGYRYGINLTSMVQSGFMFARRTFELLACNTVTVSNYSRGLALFFGDLLIATNDRTYMEQQLDRFCGTETDYRRYRLAGLRHVLKSHLYEDRLDLIAQKVLGQGIKRPLPQILVVSFEDSDRVRTMFEAQTYENKQLLVENPETRLRDIDFDYITVFSSQDYYGRNYLLDLALATRFANDPVIGKAAYYSDGELLHREKAYTRVSESVQLTRQMAARTCFGPEDTIANLRNFHLQTSILSLDEFNYCENAMECEQSDDFQLSTGVPLEKIYACTDQIRPVALRNIPIPTEELFDTLQIQDRDLVKKSYHNGELRLVREADDDTIVWLRTSKNYEVAQFTVGSRIGFLTRASERRGNARCQIEFYDENNVKRDFLNFDVDGLSLLRISDRAKTFKLIFRLRGKASVALKSICAVIPNSLLPAPFPVRSSLLLTEEYPSYHCPEKLEKLHQFAKENRLEVLLVGKEPIYLPYSEYEGVQIFSVQYDAVQEYLVTGHFESVYVHSPSKILNGELKKYSGDVKRVSV